MKPPKNPSKRLRSEEVKVQRIGKPSAPAVTEVVPSFSSMEEAEEFVRLKEEELALREGLPFLHGWKWYSWAREFFDSTSKINLLCAANQISKSSTQIRKALFWATTPSLWASLWGRRPTQFWYLYPSTKQVRAEFETKWVQFLPRGKYKTEAMLDGVPNFYAWKDDWIGKELYCIDFFVAGVKIYFKTYTQDVQNLQTGTVDALFCDEELPVELYEELMFRLSASDGYFHMVFTATLGQEFWRQAMEWEAHEDELLPDAAKWTVSMYDCMYYDDGTPSHWTAEKIERVKAKCSSAKEILRRVFGRFVKSDGGRKYEAFDMKEHMKPPSHIPQDWLIYSGVDPGSGGQRNHPAAICFVAVSPDFKKGKVFLGWRGDGVETSSGDVLNKYIQMKDKATCVGEYYDWSDKDFEIIQSRLGMSFQPADKSHERGEKIINTLFKGQMLTIFDTPELRKLGSELISLKKDAIKRKAKDDFADALRYAVTRVPWDFSAAVNKETGVPATPSKPKSPMEQQIADRREHMFHEPKEDVTVQQEMEFWNDLYG